MTDRVRLEPSSEPQPFDYRHGYVIDGPVRGGILEITNATHRPIRVRVEGSLYGFFTRIKPRTRKLIGMPQGAIDFPLRIGCTPAKAVSVRLMEALER
jgi:hypothetical protein